MKLEWWSPNAGTERENKHSEHFWIKAFGIPLHAWSLDTFKLIGEKCGGFIGIDEDTKSRNHLFWARICIRNSDQQSRSVVDLDVGTWRYEIKIIPESQSAPMPIGSSIMVADKVVEEGPSSFVKPSPVASTSWSDDRHVSPTGFNSKLSIPPNGPT